MTFNRKTTILQILPALDGGGVERGTVDMVQAIAAAGGRALVASAGGRLVPQVERAGGEHIGLALMTKDPFNIWINAGRLARIIRRERVDLVHARSRAPAWSAYWAAQRTGIPFVTTWHGIYGEDFPGKRTYNSVMARGARVIAASQTIAARVLGTYGVDPSRLRIIPRGVDTSIFDPDAVVGDRVHRLAQAWRIPTDARMVLLPARLTRWKGAEALLEAASLVNRQEVFWVLTGNDGGGGAFTRALLRRARRRKLLSNVRLPGHCDDMHAAIMLADVVVSASLKPEPFGRSIIEAQAMRRPVVAFAHGGAAETIVDGETGYLVPPGNTVELAAAIAHALDLGTDERASLGQRARESIEAHYTVAAMQSATLAVYDEVLAEHGS
jgi:glycosyltransferase involved in cell wall biosynthesis